MKSLYVFVEDGFRDNALKIASFNKEKLKKAIYNQI